MIAVKLQPAFKVIEINDWQSFDALAGEWDELVRESCDEPFYRHEFIRMWLKNFHPDAALRILTGRARDGRLLAVLPLIAEQSTFCYMPAHQLVSPSNDYSSRFDLIARDGETAAPLIFSYLAVHNDWDVMILRHVPAGGKAEPLVRAAQQAGYPTAEWESQRSPYVLLPPTYEELLRSLTAKFRNNLRRYRRRLDAAGAVSVEMVASADGLEQVLADCYELEQQGWKGRAGSALLQNRPICGFYDQLAHHAAANYSLALFLLKIDGKLVAFHLGIVGLETFYLIRNSYDEACRDCAPGHLLLAEVLKYSIARGLRRLDFLGCDLAWKQEWSNAMCTHNWLFIFRNGLFGRLLHGTKFKLVPIIKHLLGR